MALVKPTIGELVWGDDVNVALDYLDAQGVAAQATANDALELAGGTPFALPGERLIIYYAIPANVNLVFDVERAAQIFSRWDLIVFGEGLQEPASPDHASTVSVIARIKVLNPKAKIFGYVSLGVTTVNLSEAVMKDKVDKWKTTGADGMLLDEFGYDYQVPRARQNTMIDYVHGKSMACLINVWNQVEAFAPNGAAAFAVDPNTIIGTHTTYNPGGVPTTATAGDYTLLEAWIVHTDFGAYNPNHIASIFNIRARADHVRFYRDAIGIKGLGSSVVNYDTTTDAKATEYFQLTEDFSRLFGLDGWGTDALNYSATGGAGNLAQVKMWEYDRDPFVRDAGYWLDATPPDDWLTFKRDDLPLTMSGTSTTAGVGEWTSSDSDQAAPAVEDAGKTTVTRTAAGSTIQTVNLNYTTDTADQDLEQVLNNGTQVSWRNENGHYRARVAVSAKWDSTFRAIQVATQTGHPFEYENTARTTQLWAVHPDDGATMRSGVKMADVLVLAAADPIPAGTPAGTVILRLA